MNAMEALPPIDYSQLAYKRDLDALDAGVRGEIAELRGEMHGEFGKVRSEAANNLRYVMGGQLATIGILGTWITAVT